MRSQHCFRLREGEAAPPLAAEGARFFPTECFAHCRYKDGCDHIGEHRDDERELAPGSPIASVSFGACRDFLFRHKDSRGKRPRRTVEAVRLQLAHGSLLLMNPPTNTHWYHSLPIRKRVLAPRVNLTFRKILPTKK